VRAATGLRVPLPLLACLCLAFGLCPSGWAQQQVLGNIIGHMHVQRADTPPDLVMVSLEVRGAPMDSVYCDSSGTFGFHGLGPTGWCGVRGSSEVTFRLQNPKEG